MAKGREKIYWYDGLWKLLRTFLIVMAALCVVLGVVMYGYNFVDNTFIAPMEEESAEMVLFEVSRGNSVTTIANKLEENQLIRSKTAFKLYVELMDAGSKLKPGEYTLSKDMTLPEILDHLTVGDGDPIEREITVVPGNTIEDIAAYLVKEGALDDATEFLKMCRTGEEFAAYTTVDEVMNTSDVKYRKYVLEGYLAPDTYRVYTDSSAKTIISKLLGQTDVVFNSDYYSRAQELDMTMDQIITLASVIEKEAKNQDFAKVSAVFHNRINESMRLESCATVQYVIGVARLALTDADMSISSEYNTYRNDGLPVGPICNPSRAAILAALYPDEEFAEEGYLYFCSKDPKSGELDFSKTLSEHEEKSALYRPLWIESDIERGVAS